MRVTAGPTNDASVRRSGLLPSSRSRYVAMHETAKRFEPPDYEAQEIERRLVGPLEVFERDDHRLRPGQLGEERLERRRLIGFGERVAEPAGSLPGDVGQRPQRAGREQVVAPPEEHLRRRSLVGEERLDQRRLAGAGLTRDEHETARVVDLLRTARAASRAALPAPEVP